MIDVLVGRTKFDPLYKVSKVTLSTVYQANSINSEESLVTNVGESSQVVEI